MEFWGIEIKPGKPVKVEQEDGYIIHVSQVTLGELEKVKEDENVPVYVKNGDDKSKLVIGSLSKKFPQVSLDLFFEQEFEISHNSKSSVCLLGYKTPDMDEQDEEINSDSELDEYMEQQCGALAPNGMNIELTKPSESGSDDEEEGDESDSDEGEDEDESDDEEVEDEAPLKVEHPSKKRPNAEAKNNNTVASKKAKVAIQNNSSGGKKKKCPFPCGSSCKRDTAKSQFCFFLLFKIFDSFLPIGEWLRVTS